MKRVLSTILFHTTPPMDSSIDYRSNHISIRDLIPDTNPEAWELPRHRTESTRRVVGKPHPLDWLSFSPGRSCRKLSGMVPSHPVASLSDSAQH